MYRCDVDESKERRGKEGEEGGGRNGRRTCPRRGIAHCCISGRVGTCTTPPSVLDPTRRPQAVGKDGRKNKEKEEKLFMESKKVHAYATVLALLCCQRPPRVRLALAERALWPSHFHSSYRVGATLVLINILFLCCISGVFRASQHAKASGWR